MEDLIQKFIIFSESLSPTELWIVIALAFLLFLYLTLRIMGLGGVLGILLIAFFAYILYGHDSFDKYKERNKNEAEHMKLIEDELRRDDVKGS